MPDREKYIEILSKAAKTVKEFNEDTPIKISLECIEDILELLKKQEAVVRCKDCKHRPEEPNWDTFVDGLDIEFPEGSKCPCKCSDNEYYSWYPEDDWFCADGEHK